MAASKQHKVKHRDENNQGVLLSGVLSDKARTKFLPNATVWGHIDVGYVNNGNKRNGKWFKFLELIGVAEGQFDNHQKPRVTHWRLAEAVRNLKTSQIKEYVRDQYAMYRWVQSSREWVLR